MINLVNSVDGANLHGISSEEAIIEPVIARPLALVLYADEKTTQPKSGGAVSWEKITRLLTHVRLVRPEKSGKMFAPVQLAGGSGRANKNVTAVSMAVMDIDGKGSVMPLETLHERIAELEWVAYSTHSHTTEKPCYRIVFPFTRDVQPDEWPMVWEAVNQKIGRVADHSCKDIARAYYLPSCPPEMEDQKFSCHNRGNWLNPDDLLASGTAISVQDRKLLNQELPRRTNNDLQANIEHRNWTLEEVKGMLRHIDPTKYLDWWRVLTPIAERYAEEARNLARAWSRGDLHGEPIHSYDETNFEQQYTKAIQRRGIYQGENLTMGTVVMAAKKNGWTPPGNTEAIECPEWVTDLNKEYFVAREGSKVRIFCEGFDYEMGRPTLSAMTQEDFKLEHKADYVQVIIGKDIKTRSKGDAWTAHPQRRQYKTIAFIPEGKTPDGIYNLWKGFGIEPIKGDCGLALEHIREVICGGDERVYRYVMGWMALSIQQPDKPIGVALVLRGGKGTGKGTFASWMLDIFGNHGLQISDPQHLVGHFNAHLRSCAMLFADESFWAGDKKAEGTLKRIITEPTLAIEGKGRDVVQTKNRLKIIMASNSDWVVPAGHDERRFCVLNVSDCRKQDHAYFTELRNHMKNGGLSALLYELKSMNLSEFNQYDVPNTEALEDQKLLSMSVFERWLFERLHHEDKWGISEECEALELDFKMFLRESGDRYTSPATALGIGLKKIFPSLRKFRPISKHSGRRKWMYELPSVDDARGAFMKYARLEHYDWGDNDEDA